MSVDAVNESAGERTKSPTSVPSSAVKGPMSGSSSSLVGSELASPMASNLNIVGGNSSNANRQSVTLVSLILQVENGTPRRELLQPLFDMLVDGRFDLASNYLIKEYSALYTILDLLPCCSVAIQGEIWSTFTAILSRCVENLEACSKLHLLERLVELLERTNDDMLAGKIIQTIEILGSYSISVKALRVVLRYLRADSAGFRPKYSVKLTAALSTMARQKSPNCFFNLSGKKSGIDIPSIQRWYYQQGFTFNCWVRFDELGETEALGHGPRYEPHIFCLSTEKGAGFAAKLFGSRLVVEATTVSGKTSNHISGFSFQVGKWYMLTIAFGYYRLKSSDVSCYVDGVLVSKSDLKFSLISEPLTRNCIGLSPFRFPNTALKGQMAAVYVFNEALSAPVIESIFKLKSSYKYSFGSPSESKVALTQAQSKLLFDGKLRSSILFTYNPKACENGMCLNCAPVENPSVFSATPHASLLEGVRTVITQSILDAFVATGGVQVLFPLFSQLDQPQRNTDDSTSSSINYDIDLKVNSTLLALLCDLTMGSNTNQQQMSLYRGVHVISFLLGQAFPVHLNIDSLDILLGLANYLTSSDLGSELTATHILKELMEYVFFNPSLWICTETAVQEKLLGAMATDFAIRTSFKLRECVGVPKLIAILRSYYWIVPDESSKAIDPVKHPVTGDVLCSRPDESKIASLREYYILIIRHMMHSKDVNEEDVRALLEYAVRCRDCEEHVLDMLKLKLSLILDHSASFCPLFEKTDGVKVLFNLLESASDSVRILSVKCFGGYLKWCSKKRKDTLLKSQGLPALLAKKLAYHGQSLSVSIYNVLYEVLIEHIPKHIMSGKHADFENSQKIYNMPIIRSVFDLLSMDSREPASMASITQQVLSDLVILLNHERDNRRAFLEMVGWQTWLLNILRKNEVAIEDAKDAEVNNRICELAFTLFRIVLYHALRYEKDGWKVWLETVSLIRNDFTAVDTLNSESIEETVCSDLLMSLEVDIQVWMSSDKKTIAEVLVLKENLNFAFNFSYFISLLAENVLCKCSAYTVIALPIGRKKGDADEKDKCSSNDTVNKDEECDDTEKAAKELEVLINRIINAMHILVVSNEFNYSQLEHNLGMGPGGMLRLYLRLLCFKTKKDIMKSHGPRSEYSPDWCAEIDKKERDIDAMRKLINKRFSLLGPKYQRLHEYLALTLLEQKESIRWSMCMLSENDLSKLHAVIYRSLEQTSKSDTSVILCVIFHIVTLMSEEYEFIINMKGKHSSGCSNVTFGIEMAFGQTVPFLRKILKDYKSHLQSVLVGRNGKPLLEKDLECMNDGYSIVEFVMLLNSEDWQYALHASAGRLYNDMISEGLQLSKFNDERFKNVVGVLRQDFENLVVLELQKQAEYDKEIGILCRAFKEEEVDIISLNDINRDRDQASAKRILNKVVNSLTNERGAWGSTQTLDDAKTFWKLDTAEDRHRRRLRFIPNPIGSTHKEAILVSDSNEDETVDSLKVEEGLSDTPLKLVSGIKLSAKNDWNSRENFDAEIEKEVQNSDLNMSLLPFTKKRHLIVLPCKLITPGLNFGGTLRISQTTFYFTVDENELKEKYEGNPYLPYIEYLNGKWRIDDIETVQTRHFLLRNTAVEIFLKSSASIFLNFEDKASVLKAYRSLVTNNSYGSSLGFSFMQSSPLFAAERFAKSNATQRWQRRELSNFEYIMELNNLAGRTYNDLNQYPVFPWILCDFTSETLDLKDPKIYRDLSRPIGALNESRLRQFQERFSTWDDPDVPKFHYGTHYSTAGYTLYWLIRMEPFTTLFLNFQGGKFDHPGRTFSSMGQAWTNCLNSTSDVKELIPELFYLPEMFENANEYCFGKDHSGHVVDDVVLPPWAKSPEDFIRIHRAALESEYVSENLHKWIDLIFGYKQRGADAVKANNVFYYLTYQGSVDIDSIEDPIMKEAVEHQIASFGQTPSQLLAAPHPPRNSLSGPVAKASVVWSESYLNTPLLKLPITTGVPVTYLHANMDSGLIVSISSNQCFGLHRWNELSVGSSKPASNNELTFSFEVDPALSLAGAQSKRKLGEAFDQNMSITSSCFAVSKDSRFMFSCGYWDNSFKCFSTETGKLLQSVHAHRHVVTCIAMSSSNSVLVTGSKDSTVQVWKWQHKEQKLREDPLAILCGHEHAVTCVSVNDNLDLTISGSFGVLLIHTIGGDFIRSIYHDYCRRSQLISMTDDGLVIVYYRDKPEGSDKPGVLSVFSSNGKHLLCEHVAEQIMSMVASKDGTMVVTGGFSKSLCLRRVSTLQSIFTYEPNSASIRSVALSEDEKYIICGLASGYIVVNAVDFSYM
eukprot:Nk52_evm35s32 gene=Nk52_evmTU35s32